MSATYAVANHCEEHDAPGACEQQCADLVNMMTSDYSESMVYGDYLGGTSSVDVSGCHGSPPAPTSWFEYDEPTRSVRMVTVHPADCYCGKHDADALPTTCPTCGGEPEGGWGCRTCSGDGVVASIDRT